MTEMKMYLLGDPLYPWILKKKPKKKFLAPVSQLELCQAVLKETHDIQQILENLRQEYLAIAYALKIMGIDFRIIYSHRKETDMKVLGACIEILGCKLAGFPQTFSPDVVSYPRDLFTVLPNFILANLQRVKLGRKARNCREIISSPYGEGGRILVCGTTALVGEKLILENKPSQNPNTEELTRVGLKVGLFPIPLAGEFSVEGLEDRLLPNDHLDRVTCLIKGIDGKIHLVVDSQICTGKLENGKWNPLTPEESLKRVNAVCEQLGISFHIANTKVPYSLNLMQFHDGRVLMTKGDDAVEKVIAGIVGKENITTTEVPIRFLPVYTYAGIRCWINEMPTILFKTTGAKPLSA